MNQPSRRYPLLIFGINVRRWESRKDDGGWVFDLDYGLFQFWIDREADKMGPSELQKFSRFSIQLTCPLLFKFSWYWKFQTPNQPGSEKGIFIRLALWRIDYATCKYEGPGSFYLGLNDD